MPEEQWVECNLGDEVDRFFDDSSLSHGEPPCAVIFMGGPAGGKTTIRRQRYQTGHVLVDAGEIFLNLSRGGYYPFPGPFERLLDFIGPLIARRAIRERRHLVTELIGAEFQPTKSMIDALVAIDYRIELQMITCDIEEATRRNLNRADDSISAYYSEPYQRTWLHEAALAAFNPE